MLTLSALVWLQGAQCVLRHVQSPEEKQPGPNLLGYPCDNTRAMEKLFRFPVTHALTSYDQKLEVEINLQIFEESRKAFRKLLSHKLF